MKKLAAVTLIVVMVVVTAGLGLMMGLRYLFLGRLTLPTQAEYVSIAQKNQYLVQAAYDFKADHGIWPQSLGDLIPRYISRVPDHPWTTLGNDTLSIPAGMPHTYICYSFRPGEEGWSVNGDFGVGKLPLPKVASTRPALAGGALIDARLAEYDHRIRTAPSSEPYFVYHNYAQKIAFLVSLNRNADAIATCREAAKALPDWWRPQMTIAEIAGPAEAAQAEAQFREWVESRPTFIHYWYLSHHYRERGQTDKAIAALQEAVTHSMADFDQDAVWVPDAYAFDAATFACQQRQPELVLQITRLWELPRGVYNYHNDNLHAFKAAAELTLGKFDEANNDMNRVKVARTTQGLWAGNLDQLDHAVATKDQKFVYDPGKLQTDWTLLPAAD